MGTSSSSSVTVHEPTGSAQRVALELRGVTRTFPGVRALDSVDLTVLGGEVHGVLGENGAGKSTLMAVASGALTPDEGDVSINGTRLESADPSRARALGLAIVRQEPALLPDLTVAENLYLGVTPDRRPEPRRLRAWALEQLRNWSPDVTVRPEDRVDQLQPMQRFIVEICRALSQDPEVLVLDEPTEHLLRDEVDILFRHVRERTARGKSVVYISHRINEVKEVTDRLTILRNGRSVGTYEAAQTTEDQIVSLIIGRDLDVYFPDKAAAGGAEGAGVELRQFGTDGVRPLDLDLAPGQIIGLAGIDGNGQRDFLRALGGVVRSTGSVTIGTGRHSRWGRRAADRNGVRFLSGDRHNEGVLTGLSVRENIAYRSLPDLADAGWVRRGPEVALADRVVAEHKVRTPGLDTPIESLSGGNQQKALIGGALASRPKMLLVDEPTQGVDIGARSDIYALMREAADSGTLVIALCSDAAELAGIADRVLVFSRGHVISDLTGEEISERAITSAALVSDVERTRGGEAGRRRISQWLAGDVAPYAVVATFVAAVVVVGSLTNSRFLGSYNLSSVLMLAATLGLVAVGQVLVMLTGGIDVSAGPVVGLVANIASFYLIDFATLGTSATGWVLMLGGALLVGLVNWTLIDVVRLSPLIATLTTYMGVQGVSFVLRPSPDGSISRSVTSAVSTTFGPLPVAFVVVAVAVVGLEVLLRRRPGVVLRAAGSREDAARVNGIDVRRVRLFAYLGSSLCAGLAGVLFMAQTGTGDPSGGVSLTLLSITAAVVGGTSLFGGRGSFVGALLGALLIQAISAITVFLNLSSDWQYYVIGVLTLGAVALYSTARQRVAAR